MQIVDFNQGIWRARRDSIYRRAFFFKHLAYAELAHLGTLWCARKRIWHRLCQAFEASVRYFELQFGVPRRLVDHRKHLSANLGDGADVVWETCG